MELLDDEQCQLLDRLSEQVAMGIIDGLTSWEQDFLEDNMDRYDTYGDRTRLSDSQWEHLHRIAEKLGVE
jgi:ligand-binding SRPBCC domain-containing protein